MDELDGKCLSRPRNANPEAEDMADNNNYINPMASAAVVSVSKHAEYYKMNYPRRGLALIFNHEKFLQQKDNRNGSSVDVTALKKCLGNVLGFEVYVFNNLSLNEIQHQINAAATVDHSDADCILVVLLSHGNEKEVQAYDRMYNPREEIFNKFTPDNCPTLAGKPKIFVIQTCRGTKTDAGVHLQGRTEFDGLLPYDLPLMADFIEIYATSIDYYAFRNEENGSYFIQVLCEELERLYKKDHLVDILNVVKRRVATEFVSNSRSPFHNNKRQMPRVEDTLTRKIHFGFPNVMLPVDDYFLMGT